MSGAVLAHLPVLLREVLESLRPAPGDFIVDCTFGRGGHARAILDCLGSQGCLLAMDRDPEAIASREAAALSADARFILRHGSFARLGELVERQGWVGQVSAVLMDLGVSSPQLDEARRGFSFLRSGPLDMRMDTSRGPTASEWLATVSERELARVLRDFGEERFAKRIARAITVRRSIRPITTTGDLAGIIEAAVPVRDQGRHPATRSFQALRMAINHEFDELEQGLQQSVAILRPGGRLAVISFHSLEDRVVKRFMRDEERGAGADAIRAGLPGFRSSRLKRVGRSTRPGAGEILDNPRARSALLRVAERVVP